MIDYDLAANFSGNFRQIAANVVHGNIVDLTKVINDVAGKNAVDAFMDSVKGFGHRIDFGHSFEYLMEIYKEFGWEGVVNAMEHWFRDFCTPHGVPLPFANEIGQYLGLSKSTVVEWLCLNSADLIGGIASGTHSLHSIYSIKNAVSLGYISPYLAASIAVGAVSKLSIGISTGNPLTVGCGILDTITLGWGLIPLLTLGTSYFKTKPLFYTFDPINTALGTLSGLVSATLVSWLFKKEETKDKKYFWKNLAIGASVGAITGSISGFVLDSKAAIVATSTFAASVAVSVTELFSNNEEPSKDSAWIEQFPDFIAIPT